MLINGVMTAEESLEVEEAYFILVELPDPIIVCVLFLSSVNAI